MVNFNLKQNQKVTLLRLATKLNHMLDYLILIQGGFCIFSIQECQELNELLQGDIWFDY